MPSRNAGPSARQRTVQRPHSALRPGYRPFVFLGSREEGQELLQELDITYPAGSTEHAKVVQDYRVLGMPTTIFIKPNGEIMRKWTGLLTEDKLAELIQDLIAAS